MFALWVVWLVPWRAACVQGATEREWGDLCCMGNKAVWDGFFCMQGFDGPHASAMILHPRIEGHVMARSCACRAGVAIAAVSFDSLGLLALGFSLLFLVCKNGLAAPDWGWLAPGASAGRQHLPAPLCRGPRIPHGLPLLAQWEATRTQLHLFRWRSAFGLIRQWSCFAAGCKQASLGSQARLSRDGASATQLDLFVSLGRKTHCKQTQLFCLTQSSHPFERKMKSAQHIKPQSKLLRQKLDATSKSISHQFLRTDWCDKRVNFSWRDKQVAAKISCSFMLHFPRRKNWDITSWEPPQARLESKLSTYQHGSVPWCLAEALACGRAAEGSMSEATVKWSEVLRSRITAKCVLHKGFLRPRKHCRSNGCSSSLTRVAVWFLLRVLFAYMHVIPGRQQSLQRSVPLQLLHYEPGCSRASSKI